MTRAGLAFVVILDVAMATSGGFLIWRHVHASVAPVPPPVVKPVVVALAPDAGRPVVTRPTPPTPPSGPSPPSNPGHGRPSYTSLPNKPPTTLPVMTYGDGGVTSAAVTPLPAIDAAPPPVDALPPVPLAPPEPEHVDAGAVGPHGHPPDVEVATESVRGVVDKHRNAVSECYRRAAKLGTRGQPLVGRLEIQLSITPDGSPQEVKVVGNKTGSDELGTCVAGLMASWKYPNPNHESIDVVWPFTFRPR